MSVKVTVYRCGNARFSVLSAHCIRMEYQAEGKFIDAPSWFAASRRVTDCEHALTEDETAWTITTPALTLRYRKPATEFSAGNLSAVVNYGDTTVNWVFGMNNPGNLGGTLQTLDAISKPVPLPDGLLSRDGWYCLDDSKTHLFTGDWISPRPEGSGSDHYLFAYGKDYKAALKSLVAVSGDVPLPRKCIFGSWYSRWHRYSEEDYRQIVQEYDEHGIPLDIMVMDMDWHTKENATHGHGWANMLGWTGWSWNPELFPDPKRLLDWFHEQGLRVTLNAHPHDGVREHEDCYADFMKEMEADPAKPLAFTAGDKKYLDAYFNVAHGALEKQGVDFWWVDWQQDSIMPEAAGIPGMKHLPLLNHAYYRFSERDSGKRGLGFSRWSGWGDQRYPIHFSGDATSNWDMLAYEIYFTATAGNVGCFFWSHDIGGFHGKRNPELYARWVQFGSTTAAMRLHSTGDELDRRPWKWGEEVEESIRRSFHLRSRLMPYIYSQAKKSCDETVPLNRPLYFEYADVEQSYLVPHEYMFGDGFLVAPVISCNNEKGIAETQVWLPEGEWVHWFSGTRYAGGQTVQIESDLNHFPLFVRAGFPVTMQPFTLRMTAAKLEELTVRVYPATGPTEQVTTLYEDDGHSREYREGRCVTTDICWTQAADEMTLRIAAADGTYPEHPKTRRILLEVGAAASSARIGDKTIAGTQNDGLTTFDLGLQPVTSALEVTVIL